jgi:hypothetical protein
VKHSPSCWPRSFGRSAIEDALAVIIDRAQRCLSTTSSSFANDCRPGLADANESCMLLVPPGQTSVYVTAYASCANQPPNGSTFKISLVRTP